MGATKHQAWVEFADRLKAAVSCLGPAKVVMTDGQDESAWRINQGDHPLLVPLADGPPLALSAAMRFRYVPGEVSAGRDYRWAVSTTAYRYQVLQGGRELISWHWHPGGDSSHKRPHAHVGGNSLTPDGVITQRTHLPTGRTPLEAVVRFLVTDLGGTPARSDWDKTLTTAQAWFEEHATWR